MTKTGIHALFLDRDGVINHDSGYTSCVEEFRFIDGIFDLCRAAELSGYLVIVVTNQAGIGRGYYSEDDFYILTDWMTEQFKTEGVLITDVFHCPFHPEHGKGQYKIDSFNRKPKPGMLLLAAEKHGLDLNRSIMIGDKDTDMQAAREAGVKVRCHYLSDEQDAVLPSAATHIIHSLHEAISLLNGSSDE